MLSLKNSMKSPDTSFNGGLSYYEGTERGDSSMIVEQQAQSRTKSINNEGKMFDLRQE